MRTRLRSHPLQIAIAAVSCFPAYVAALGVIDPDPPAFVTAVVWALEVALLLWVWRRSVDPALSAARRRLAFVEGTSQEASWECDARGNITFASRLFSSYFSYSPREMLRLNVLDLTFPEEHERLRQRLQEGSGWRKERFRCAIADGSEHWFEGNAVAIVGPHGRVVGFTGSCHPIKDAAGDGRLRQIAQRIRLTLEDDTLHTVFQPILSMDTGTLVGAEALSRFESAEELAPDVWFAEAAEVSLGGELEIAAVRKALVAAQALPTDIYISVNVSPLTLTSAALRDALLSGPVPPSRLVIEVTEHVSIEDYEDLRGPVALFRKWGIRFAVDDAGAGYASFRHILLLAPEFIKLDRSLIVGIDSDPARRALAAAVVMFGLEMNSQIVAEGIETVSELRAAQTIGIDCGQGYLFGRPTADWRTWSQWHAAGPLYSMRRLRPESSANSGDELSLQ